jgi:hypothetical protein
VRNPANYGNDDPENRVSPTDLSRMAADMPENPEAVKDPSPTGSVTPAPAADDTGEGPTGDGGAPGD